MQLRHGRCHDPQQVFCGARLVPRMCVQNQDNRRCPKWISRSELLYGLKDSNDCWAIASVCASQEWFILCAAKQLQTNTWLAANSSSVRMIKGVTSALSSSGCDALWCYSKMLRNTSSRIPANSVGNASLRLTRMASLPSVQRSLRGRLFAGVY